MPTPKVTGTVRSKNPLKGAVEIIPVRCLFRFVFFVCVCVCCRAVRCVSVGLARLARCCASLSFCLSVSDTDGGG
jgi:hypothetical protein